MQKDSDVLQRYKAVTSKLKKYGLNVANNISCYLTFCLPSLESKFGNFKIFRK